MLLGLAPVAVGVYVGVVRPLLLSASETMARRALQRNGAVSHWFPTRHGHVHCYRLRGNGDLPPVVLFHGLGTSATAFAPLMRALRPHVRGVIAPDSLGHGFSAGQLRPLTAEQLLGAAAETLNGLIDEPALLVGNSMGGALALELAALHPEVVRGLVLVSPAGAPFDEAEWAELAQTFALHTRDDALNLLKRIYRTLPWYLSLVAHEMPDHFATPAMRSLLANRPEAALVAEEKLRQLSAPTLLLWGRGDRLLPRRQLDYFREHLPSHAVIEEPEEFGHSPHLDATRALAERIVRFARTIP
jgi:pimeloyl-ACP methyl ester carboxylesterase